MSTFPPPDRSPRHDLREALVEDRTNSCLAVLRGRVPAGCVVAVQSIIRQLMLFADVFRLRPYRDDSICATCTEVFGEQFLIRVGLERAVLSTLSDLNKRVAAAIIEILCEKLSMIPSESDRKAVVGEIMFLDSVRNAVHRFVGWLILNEQTIQTNVAE